MARTERLEAEFLQETAGDLHRAALRLMRRLRLVDEVLNVSTARLSALSVLVFSGPTTLGRLAKVEQVSQPTMSALVKGLVADKLIKVQTDPVDGRVRRLKPTAKGRRLLEKGRRNRVDTLAAMLSALDDEEVFLLKRCSSLVERMLEGKTE